MGIAARSGALSVVALSRELLLSSPDASPFVLVTVLSASGIRTVRPGTQMGVFPDAPPIGSAERRLDRLVAAAAREVFSFDVAGGLTESPQSHLLAEAAWRFEPPDLWRPTRRTLQLPEPLGEGHVEVFFNPVLETNENRTVLEQLVNGTSAGVLATVLAATARCRVGSLHLLYPGDAKLSVSDGLPVDSAAIHRAAQVVLRRRKGRRVTTDDLELFIEPVA